MTERSPRTDLGILRGYRLYRTDDDRFDAAMEDAVLRDLGVIEDDQPTEYSHYAYMSAFEKDATGDFSPAERMEIRAHLGLGPFGEIENG